MFNDFETKLSPDSNWELKYIHIYHGIYISPSENEYKKGNKTCLNSENEFNLESKKTEEMTFYILHIKSKSYHVMIRSSSRISLEYIIFHSTLTDEKDIGRPLTFYPHLSNIESPLEAKRLNDNNYRGFVNLIVTALILSHFRLMWENYVKYGIMITPHKILSFISGSENLLFILAIFGLSFFAIVITFYIEIISSRSKSKFPFELFHVMNLAALLLVPISLHKYDIVNPGKRYFFIYLVSGVFLLTTITVIFLKLYSYIHFWKDVRIFISNKTRLIKTDPKLKELQGDLYKEIEEVIDNYPKNLIFSDLVKFLFTPVLCFQFKYPRTNRIRKRAVLNYLMQFLMCMLLLIFITGQYMLPTIKNSIKYIHNDDYYNLIERVLKLAIPTVYGWIIMFYAFFHSWMNLWAELTQYGDRTFYKDWWNSLYLDEYWRTWNLPTHYWLMRHIYNPLRRRKIDKFTCSGIVFFVSALFHEYIISGAVGYLNYWAFIAMFANFPVSIFQGWVKQQKFLNNQSQLLNVSFWVSFCFLGQPLCMMLYFYSYYVKYEIPISH